MPPENLRTTYIFKTLGLSHDPFDGPVAEQEIQSTDKEPFFFAYYTDSRNSKLNRTIPQAMRDARNGLIFGRPGSGKTTLRYILESDCRTVQDYRTLAVTYELSHLANDSLTADEHQERLADELAIDFFIQVIERIDSIEPNPVQKEHFSAQIARVWPRLHRVVRHILADDLPSEEYGVAGLWPNLNRLVLRHIPPSQKIRQLLAECMPRSPGRSYDSVNKTGATSMASLEAGLAAARAWGFDQVFVLVDGVDAYEREIKNMMELIAPLLGNLSYWQKQNLFFYFFLTDELRPVIDRDFGRALKKLPFPPFKYRIHWNKNELIRLLHKRLRAAGSRVPGFNALAAEELGNKLEDFLIQAAENSPRQLLRVVSSLIDVHAEESADQPLFTVRDWHLMHKRWSYGRPIPPDIVFPGLTNLGTLILPIFGSKIFFIPGHFFGEG